MNNEEFFNEVAAATGTPVARLLVWVPATEIRYPKKVEYLPGAFWEWKAFAHFVQPLGIDRWFVTRQRRLNRWSNVRYWKRRHELTIRRRRKEPK